MSLLSQTLPADSLSLLFIYMGSYKAVISILSAFQ